MKLIKLNPDHYVIVDGKTKAGDYYLDDTNAIRKIVISDPDYWAKRPEYRKITHSTQPIEYDRLPGGGWNEVGYQSIKELSLSEVESLIRESVVVKSSFSLSKYFEQLRFDKNHHLGMGDIRLTIGQQEEICALLERQEDIAFIENTIRANSQPQTEWEVEFVDGKLKLK